MRSLRLFYTPHPFTSQKVLGVVFPSGEKEGDEGRRGDESVDGFSGQGKRVCGDRT